MSRTILAAVAAVLLIGPIPATAAEAPKLGEKFRAAVARTAKEADAIEDLMARAWVLGETGNARALAGDKKGALDDLHKAALMAKSIEDARTRSQTFAMIGLGLGRAGDVAGARDAFRESLLANDALEGLVRAHDLAEIALKQARAGDLAAARETFAEAARFAATIKADDERKAGISEGYHLAHVIGKQAEAGFVAEALKLAEESKILEGFSASIQLMAAMGDALWIVPGADGHRIIDWVRRQAEMMKDGTGQADGDFIKPSLLGWVAKWDARLGDFDAATTLVRSIGGKDRSDLFRIIALIDIAGARIEAGDKEAARDLLREAGEGLAERAELAPGVPNGQWLLEIAKLQARAGDIDRVTRSVAAIAAEADAMPAPPPGKEQDEDAKEALEARRLKAKMHHVGGLAVLGSARAVRGDVEGARRCLREATDLAKSASEDGMVVELDTWKEIATAYAMAGDLASAIKTADTVADDAAEAEKALPDPPVKPVIEQLSKVTRSHILGDVIDDLLDANDRATALRLIDSDPTKALAASKLQDVILSHARAGEIDAALGLLDRLPDPEARSSALIGIAEAAARDAKSTEKKAP
ncbi:MAG TPA: hypothetical protein VG406_08720 [Isosphaeraceae bacterium]|jgi:tetratricopeptide (TPR) repeat protein|nr:hypothetical protein [Isosphaeraceae bacterium]